MNTPSTIPEAKPPPIIHDPGCAEATELYNIPEKDRNPVAELMIAAHRLDAKTHEEGCFVLRTTH